MTKKSLNSDMSLWRRADLLSESGTLDRPFQMRQFPVPKIVELSGDRLVWTSYLPGRGFVYRKAEKSPDLLLRFIKLADASPLKIRDFARRWGVLAICEHGLPVGHSKIFSASPLVESGCQPLKFNAEYSWEPLEKWQYFSRIARAMLNIAARLHQDRLGDPQDWLTIYESPGHVPQGSIGYERLLIKILVNDWLSMGNVRPVLEWAGESAFVAFDSDLFGILAHQLMLLISRSKGIGICSGCGEPYSPERRPRINQRNYCKQCGRRAACRDAKADQRRRERADRVLK